MPATNLTHGATTGGHRTSEYVAWSEMIYRCTRRSHVAYPNYGGRGIGVCMRWIGPSGFRNFIEDVGHRPSAKHSIDRFPDNDGHYEPGNVRWATSTQQNRNRRNNRFIEHNGQRLTMAEWAEKAGISRELLHYRLKAGWIFSDAINTPPRKTRKQSNG